MTGKQEIRVEMRSPSGGFNFLRTLYLGLQESDIQCILLSFSSPAQQFQAF